MKNFTNNFKQFTSRLSARWLIMALMMLVGTSSAWGWTVYYVNSTNWNKLYIHYWGGTNPSPSSWGDNPPMVVQGEKVLGLTIYSYEIGDNTSCIFKDNKGDTSNKTGDLTSLQPDKPYYYDGKWYSIREIYENFWMFYMYQSYGGTLCLKADNNTVASNTTTQMATSGYAYVVVEKTKVDGKTLNVSNNCGNWNGTGGKTGGVDVGTEKVHPGCFYKTGASNTITKASTLSSLSIASSINKADANSVAIKVKSTSSTSSYSNGNTNYALKAMFYVDNKYYGTSNQLSTSETSTTLDLSDLADGQHTLSVVLTDGKIYYSDSKTTTFTIVSCTPPDAPDFGSVSSAEYCYGDPVSFPTIDGVTLQWYDEETGGNVITSPKTDVGSTNYYAAVVEECESTERTPYTITIKTKPTVTLNPTENTVCSGVALEGITRYVEIESTEGSQISWYAAAQCGDALAPSIALDVTSYFAEATLNGCSSDRAKFTITDVLSAPTEVPNVTAPATICAGESAVLKLNNKGANYTYKVNEVEVDFTNNEYTVFPTITTDYKVSVENKCGSLSTTKTITVNPKPSIGSIAQNVALPVPFEDVVLTATDVTQGAEVKWYKGNNVTPVATGTTYIVTSEITGDVIVKAKAFLGDCESDFKEHKVTFGEEEDCTPIIKQEERDVEQKTKTKIICTTTRDAVYCYVWNGTTYPLGAWGADKSKMTEVGDGVFEIEFDNSGLTTFNMIFHNNNGKQTADIEGLAVNKVHKYSFEAGDKTGYSKAANYPITYTKKELVNVEYPAPLSAPAVKTVSATSVEGSGVVNFTGKVIKTGCAAATKIYVGYQYKLATEPWPNNVTAGNAKGNLIAVPDADGKTLHETYSTTISGLTDENYVFRAYIINGYNFTNGNYDQGVYYGIDIPVKVSTKKYPIENLQIKLDQNVTYCVGDDAYIKLIYDGSRLKPEDDVINISSTLENTFTLVEGEADLYTFVVKGNETITVNAKNKENTDNPTAELTIKTYAVPVIPSIDIDNTTICSDDQKGAKIKVSNPQVGITYQVYKILGENPATTHGEPKEYSEGELYFNSMKDAGTYYVRAYNEQCPNAIAQSLDEILTVIDADATSISISPEAKTVNPWVPVTFTVTKQGNYDYTFSCKEEGNDVTSNMVINKSGDTYVVKFPKPDGASVATDLNGQVTFADKKYIVEVKLNADVQCGTFDDESTVTLEPVNEICK